MRHTHTCIIICATAAALVTPPSRTLTRIAKTPRTPYAKTYDFNSDQVPVGAAARRAVEFFAAWNKRDMEAACACFSDDCVYEDTQYSGAFEGKAKLREHLDRVADALPDTFAFVVDEAVTADKLIKALNGLTGHRWLVSVSEREEGAPTLKEQELEALEQRKADASQDPLVRAILDGLPKAKIVAVHLPPGQENAEGEEDAVSAFRSDLKLAFGLLRAGMLPAAYPLGTLWLCWEGIKDL